MDEILRQLEGILNSNETLSNDFGKFSKVYLMATENIRGFLEQYNLRGKNILSVAGSGDQMLNAYLMGAEKVTIFDINPLAFNQAKLKKAALETLTYEEFINFFFPQFHHFFDKDLFSKLCNRLDDETIQYYEFWYKHCSSEQILHKMFYKFQPSLQKAIHLNAYLEQENFQKLAIILKEKELKCIESDLTNLVNILVDCYDMILLSNISDSIDKIWFQNALKNFKRLIHSISKYLNPNGIIQVGYIYDTNQKQLFSDDSTREKVFTPKEFSSTTVEGYRFYSDCDKIITFQKKKKKIS